PVSDYGVCVAYLLLGRVLDGQLKVLNPIIRKSLKTKETHSSTLVVLRAVKHLSMATANRATEIAQVLSSHAT
ncbi:hypothetical protein, partial [Salinisphaera shabanensis]|uniref:hypothetical protein n=1 Tax=Salinisphaera shabanensis TaxID=180542 RepID=UPI0033421633